MKKIAILLALPALLAFALPLRAEAQDVTAGETSFRKCLPCHAIGEDAKNKVGPELNGLDGRKAGAVESYSYSPFNKQSGIVWNKDIFRDYIQSPQSVIPRTKMTFAGIRNEKEIADLWAYLARFDAEGKLKQ